MGYLWTDHWIRNAEQFDMIITYLKKWMGLSKKMNEDNVDGQC